MPPLSPLDSASPIPAGSRVLAFLFTALTLTLATLFVAAVYRSATATDQSGSAARRGAALAALFTAAWLALTAGAAAGGLLRFTAPPTMLLLLPGVLAVALGVGLSPLGRRLAIGLPLAALVGFQGFRVLVELLLHRAYSEGLMPVQMSYSGRNADIVSGITALALGAWLATGRRSPRLVALWNLLGVALLANILVVAVLSMPTPLRRFMNEPANVWVSQAPWIWLPAVMVLAAILGHVLVARRLLADHRAAVAAAAPAAFVTPPSRAAHTVTRMLVLVMLVGALGCSGDDPVAPNTTRLVGSVTLLGQEDPGTPAGARLELFVSEEDLETGHAAHVIPLAVRPGADRIFDFVTESVNAGRFYVAACFAFGCGQHRDPGTGELVPVDVVGGRTNTLQVAF